MIVRNSSILFEALRKIKKEDIDILKLATLPRSEKIDVKPCQIDMTFTPKMMKSFYYSNESLSADEVLLSLINSQQFGVLGYHLTVPVRVKKENIKTQTTQSRVCGFIYDFSATNSIGKFLYNSNIDQPTLYETIRSSIADYEEVYNDIQQMRLCFQPKTKKGYVDLNAKSVYRLLENNSQKVFSGRSAGKNFFNLVQIGYKGLE